MPGRRWSLDVFLPAAAGSRSSRWQRMLRRLGPTWRASPIRRIIQVLTLALFLYLFFYVAWPYAEDFSTQVIARKQWLPLQAFLWADPLVGLSTAVATRRWNVAVGGMLGILFICLWWPRGFCGYLCPLGTLIDAFDWLIGKRVRRWRVRRLGPWRHLRYYVLTAVLIAATLGILVSGYVSAIPVVTRGLLFTAGRVQLGVMKNWSVVGVADVGMCVSVGLFLGIFLLGLFSPRFWCRYVCPSGAVFSMANWLRLSRRQVHDTCIECGKCKAACPFDAIRDDYSTRGLDCTFCQTCGGVCPAGAIGFEAGIRQNENEPRKADSADIAQPPLSRRGFVVAAIGGAIAAGTTRHIVGSRQLVRPPGSVPEAQFLDLCIRCGECFKVCPGPVLQPAGLAMGLEALWTPMAVLSHAGCHQDCNFCTQVCPTGAIQPLSIEEKRKTKMGLAVIDTAACLPHRGERDCQLCYQECEAAGYHAIQMRTIQLKVGEVPAGVASQLELEEMARIEAPFVDAAKCVGCGLCEYRCHTALVKQQTLLPKRAIVVEAVERPPASNALSHRSSTPAAERSAAPAFAVPNG
ncbi:MAG: 4Fe-4S binding protein [Bacillota bacterium]